MTDTIVQEVRAIRAQIAAEFGGDRARFWNWARRQQEAERRAQHKLPLDLNSTRTPPAESPSPRGPRQRPARPSAVAV